MNRKSIHQNLMRTVETLAGMNMTRWAVTLAVVMITMFALPIGAWAQQITYAYTIKVEYNDDKGTLLVNNDMALLRHAQPGQTVTILAMPQTGYGLNSLTVTDEESNSIQLIQSAADPNEYSFQLPEGVLSKAITLTVKGEFGTGGNSPIGGQGGTEISEATYAINGAASPAGGGTVTAYNGNDVITSAKVNTVVTLTATPAEGYHFLKWIVTSSGNAVALGDEYSETTSFTIGQRGVSAQAVFVYGNSENCISYPAEGGWIVRDGTKVFVTVNEADGYYLKSVIRSTEAPTESTEQTTELSNGVSLGEPIAAVGKKPYYYASEGGYISAAFRKPSDDLRVTFNMNGHGTAIATQKLTFNAQGTATVTKPTDPEEEDCIFFGWYKDKNFTQPFNFSTVISKESLKYNKEIDCYPLTLYAKWRHISIVTFYANGGTGTMEPDTMDYESQYTIPECTFYSGGLPFDGWATSANGKVKYQPGDKITLTDNLTLYAKWIITEVTIDGLNYKITSLNPFTVELTGYEGDELTGVLNIPASVKIGGNDYSVTSISGNAFYNTSITSLIIPDAITTIGEYAFYGCLGLKSVMLGSGVTSIEKVFTGCRILESFTVDENNANYKSLDGVLFNKAGTTLIKYPHAKSESYTVPEGVTTIGNEAFKNNNVLTSIIIGNDVTSIGGYAFHDCGALTSVIIGNGVTSIGECAFKGCGALTSVTFGNSVTSIGSWAFQVCLSLTSVNIPATVTTIGSWAFMGCRNLTSVTINATSLTTYGKDAFKADPFGNASGLKIYVPAGSEDTYKAGWSEYAEVIEAIPEPETRILMLGKGWNANGASVTASYSLGDDIITYTGEDFSVEPAPVLEGTTVTLTITPGEDYVVDEVTVTKYEEPEAQQPGEAFVAGGGSRTRGDGDDAVVVSHTNGTKVWSFTMPAYDAEATVTYKKKKTIEAGWITVDVGDGLTYNGKEQKPSVTVKDGTTTLSAETDYEVTYSNNMNACEATAENAPTATVTVKDGNDTYTGSASVTFAIGTAKVKASGFAVEDKEKNGDDVTAVLITTDVKLYGVITGSGDKQGDEVRITGVTGTFLDAKPGKNKTVNLDYTNASLTGKDAGNYTLDKDQSQPTATGKIYIKPTKGTVFTVDGLKYKITNDDPCKVELTGVDAEKMIGAFTIPATITYAGIDYSVTNIGDNAFNSCDKLTSVTIPSSVTSIGNAPFNNCQSLTTITVDGNNTEYKSVDGVLFNIAGSKLIQYLCGKSSTSYTVPDGVTIIGRSAFDNCKGLKEVTIPSSITNIVTDAFYGCSALVSVTIHAQSLKEYGSDAFYNNASGRKIYVPDGSVDTYKAGWSAYAKDIEAIPAPVPLVDDTSDHQQTVDGKTFSPLTSSGASQLGVKAGDGIYLESAAASRMMIAENGGIEVKGKESMYMLAAGLEDGSKLQVGGSGFTPFAQMGGSSLRAESGARTRGYGDMPLVIGKVYEVVGNGDIILTFVPDNENGMTIKAIDITPKVNLDESAAQQPLGENLKDRNIRMTYERTIDAPTDAAHDVELDGQNATLFTVCLPEAPEIATGVKYYKLSGATATSFTFTEVETPVAFTPYVAAVTATSNFQIKYPDITFDTGAALGSFSADGYTLKGTLTGIIHANAIGLLILQGQGNWGTVVSGKTGAYVPPFRAYIEADNVSGARTVGSSFGDDATAVRSIRTIDKDGTERMYDLQGRRIDQPAKKGIYIINGRKEVLK